MTWTSSEEDIATVENGVVTAKAVGETTITATAGDVTDVCTVEVIECGHTDGTNNDGQCRTCGYQFAFKATDADGNLKGFYDKIYVKVSDKALSDAKKSGEAVKIPTGVKAGEDSNSAPVVKIDLPKNAGETMIEVPVDNVTPGTVAVIVHEDGTEEILSSSKPTEDGLEFTIDGSATIKVIDNSKTFVDTGDHWAKGAIDYISARDLVSGVGDKLFAPDLTATRAQLVTMLWRTAGSPTAGSETKFTDVPADSYYAQAVAWAAANGITTGVGSGRFDPEAPCTRAQLATFLYQNMK